MEDGQKFKECVQFELPDLAAAARLVTLLRHDWLVHVHERGDVAVVTAHLGPAVGDLATLLRSVEDWVAQESLLAIRFELDGRGYVLESGEVDWAAMPGVVAA